MDVRLESLFPPPVLHPGVVLRQEFLERYGIPQAELAKTIGVNPTNFCKVTHGHRAVTVDLGRRLAMALGTSPEYWLLRQLAWNLEHAGPLPLIEPMPQLPKPATNGTGSDIRLSRTQRSSNGRPRRSTMAQDRRF